MFCGRGESPIARSAAYVEDSQWAVGDQVGQSELAVEKEREGLVFDGKASGFGGVIWDGVSAVGVCAAIFKYGYG